MKNNLLNDYISGGYNDHLGFTANTIAKTYMSKEEFSNLGVEEFTNMYLDVLTVAMHKINERSEKEKKENSFFKR